jgi:double-strand break repair protein MRE11
MLKFLICTDNHLGYNEKDPICGMDSFTAFEELLQIARSQQVDAILHCGDLFHENKPSRKTMFTTIELLRRYCLGDSPCSLEYLSDAKQDFGYPCVNFQDPDINIAIPIFAIHGNHDDPVGEGNLSAWNLLAATRLVNYFGKATDLDDIRISPILLRKGSIQVALYGLGNVRDERLHRTFQNQKVSFLHPLGQENKNNWFNLMMIHQNRVAHSRSNYIPEEFLDPLLDLVIWGHEHESLLEPQLCSKRGFHVIQPGSSVATSLCDAESHAKYAAVIRVAEGGKWDVEKIKLQSVRPFLIKDISMAVLCSVVEVGFARGLEIDQKRVSLLLAAEVQRLLEVHQRESPACDKLPLVRVRVDYSGGFPTVNPQCFGHQFVGKVANPKDILNFYRRRTRNITGCSSSNHSSLHDAHYETTVKDSTINIESVISSNMRSNEWDILPPEELFDKIRQFVEKDDKDAIDRWISQRLQKVNARAADSVTLQQIRDKITEMANEQQLTTGRAGMVRAYSGEEESNAKFLCFDD